MHEYQATVSSPSELLLEETNVLNHLRIAGFRPSHCRAVASATALLTARWILEKTPARQPIDVSVDVCERGIQVLIERKAANSADDWQTPDGILRRLVDECAHTTQNGREQVCVFKYSTRDESSSGLPM